MQTLPDAPGANGQPPSPPIDESKVVTPSSIAARMFGIAIARVSCVWSVHSTPGKRGIRCSSVRVTWRGFAMPVVSATPMARAPIWTSSRTTHSSRATGTSPSKGHPNDVEIPAWTGTRARSAIPMTPRSVARDSATVMLTFARLRLSLAETTVWIASTPASTARAAPLSFGTSAA